MVAKAVLLASALCLMTASAQAADAPLPVPAKALPVPAAPIPTLPIFAQNPSPEASRWSGLYVGTEIFGVGGKGLKGGFGGGAYAGYSREFANNWVVGVKGSTGYTPSLLKFSPASGYDFASANLKAGYDMGRFMPFVTAGVGFAKPNLRSFGFTGAAGAANDLFNDTGNLQTVGTIGAGVDYKITNDVSVELAVSAYRGPAAAAWP